MQAPREFSEVAGTVAQISRLGHMTLVLVLLAAAMVAMPLLARCGVSVKTPPAPHRSY